jgi:tryptophan halogenase
VNSSSDCSPRVHWRPLDGNCPGDPQSAWENSVAEPVRNITIVGGGTSGWVAASYLARLFQRRVASGDLSITVIESPDVGIIGVGESTARPMADLLRILGIREADFIRRCNATFKLSGWFANWDVDGAGEPVSWVNPFFSQTDLHGVNPAYLFASYAMHPDGGPTGEGFTEAISVCPGIIRAHKGPRRIGDGDYKGEIPYSYHMDAVELAKIL